MHEEEHASADDLEYPTPYSEASAELWAKEDALFSKEIYEQDPYFDKDNQAELRRRIEGIRKGHVATAPWEAVG
jgi:U3 small nucleolar ribonucleoprotein component